MRTLEVGHKYKDREGDVWVCYRVEPTHDAHHQAYCIRQRDGNTEYFYLDGRYDTGGTRSMCIVEEIDPPDLKQGLNELRDEALRIAVEHGFKDATVGEDLMLMVSELAEALEDHRLGHRTDEFWYLAGTMGNYHASTYGSNLDGSQRKLCGIPSEIADVIIRALHFSGKHKIDIARAVREKMAYNNSRPFMHGKKL